MKSLSLWIKKFVFVNRKVCFKRSLFWFSKVCSKVFFVVQSVFKSFFCCSKCVFLIKSFNESLLFYSIILKYFFSSAFPSLKGIRPSFTAFCGTYRKLWTREGCLQELEGRATAPRIHTKSPPSLFCSAPPILTQKNCLVPPSKAFSAGFEAASAAAAAATEDAAPIAANAAAYICGAAAWFGTAAAAAAVPPYSGKSSSCSSSSFSSCSADWEKGPLTNQPKTENRGDSSAAAFAAAGARTAPAATIPAKSSWQEVSCR